MNRAVLESWSTSNGTFKMDDVELSFVEYAASKRVHLHPDTVEYPQGGTLPLCNLIIGKQTLYDVGTGLDFVVGRLDMYRTKVLLYRTMVLMARLTKVRR